MNIPNLLTRFTQGNQFRQVTLEDLVPGAELLLVEVRRSIPIHSDVSHLGDLPHIQTRITIDEKSFNPERTHVFYHQIEPAWDGQCFIPIADMISEKGVMYVCPENWLEMYLVRLN